MNGQKRKRGKASLLLFMTLSCGRRRKVALVFAKQGHLYVLCMEKLNSHTEYKSKTSFKRDFGFIASVIGGHMERILGLANSTNLPLFPPPQERRRTH